MKILAVGGALAVAGALVLACSSDDSNGSGTPATNADGGPSGATTNPDGTCSGPTSSAVGTLPSHLGRISLTTDAIVAWDLHGGDAATVGTGTTGAIAKLPKTGGDSAVLYKPTATSHKVLGVIAEGADVYTIEEDDTNDTTTKPVLLRIPAAGGAATTLATLPSGDGALLLIDATNIYYTRNESLWRVARAGGAAPVEMAKLGNDTASGTFDGDDVVLQLGIGGKNVVYRVAKTAVATTPPTKLTDDSNCIGSLATAGGAFYCFGALSVTRFDASFKATDKVYSVLDEDPNGALPSLVGLDGNHVFFAAHAASGKGSTTTLRTFDVGATSSKIIGCDVGVWTAGLVDGTSVYLLQPGADADAPNQIVKYARP